MRIMPYRTTENMIDGLVLTFVNVSKVRSLQMQTERLLGALARSQSTVFGHGKDLRYEWAYGTVFGHPSSGVTGKTDRDLLGKEDGERVMAIKRDVLESGTRLRKRLRIGGRDGDGRFYDLYVEASPGGNGEDGVVGVLTRVEDSES